MFFGDCRGRMARERAGSNGFGYDPVFVPDATGDNRTMAELTDAEKDAISHRGHAVRALIEVARLSSGGGRRGSRRRVPAVGRDGRGRRRGGLAKWVTG